MKSEQVYQQLRESCLKAKENGLKFKTQQYFYSEIENGKKIFKECCALGSYLIYNIDQYKTDNLNFINFISKKLNILTSDVSAVARGFDNIYSEYESNLEYYNVGQKLREEFLEI